MTDSCIPGLAEYDALVDEEAGNLLRKIQERTESLKKQPSKAALCKIYKGIKPLILDVLPWIEKLSQG